MSTDFRAETADPRTSSDEHADALERTATSSDARHSDARASGDGVRRRASEHTDVEGRLRAAERAADATPNDDAEAERAPTPDAGDRGRSDADRALAARLTTVERRLDDLDAVVQSIQGYVGTVDAVNESVERRANAALAAAERPRPTHPLPDLPDPKRPEDEADEAPGFFGRLVGR